MQSIQRSLSAVESLYHRRMCSLIAPHTLLSAENRVRCIEKLRLATKSRRPADPSNRHASVLIALCTDSDTNEISLLYTQRSGALRSHKWQIAFPGGIRDDTDSDAVECALRETEEEIGLPRERIEIWGQGMQFRPSHTAAITPVVGVVENLRIAELKLNRQEVAAAFTVPLKSLLSPKALRHTQFRAGVSTPTFRVDDCNIWGITGYLTRQFLCSLVPDELEIANHIKEPIKFVQPFRAIS